MSVSFNNTNRSTLSSSNKGSSRRNSFRRHLTQEEPRNSRASSVVPAPDHQPKHYYNHDLDDELTVLHQMCRLGHHLDEVKQLAERCPALIIEPTSLRGDTALHFAVSNGDLNAIHVLLNANRKAALIKSSKNGNFGDCVSPLHMAISLRSPVEVIQALIQSNPRCLRLRDGQGHTPIELACEVYPGLNLYELAVNGKRNASRRRRTFLARVA